MKLYGTVELVKGGEETVLILDIITVKKFFKKENVAIIVSPDNEMHSTPINFIKNVSVAPIGEAKLFASGILKSTGKEQEIQIVKFCSMKKRPCAIILLPNGQLTWTYINNLSKFRYEKDGGQL